MLNTDSESGRPCCGASSLHTRGLAFLACEMGRQRLPGPWWDDGGMQAQGVPRPWCAGSMGGRAGAARATLSQEGLRAAGQGPGLGLCVFPGWPSLSRVGSPPQAPEPALNDQMCHQSQSWGNRGLMSRPLATARTDEPCEPGCPPTGQPAASVRAKGLGDPKARRTTWGCPGVHRAGIYGRATGSWRRPCVVAQGSQQPDPGRSRGHLHECPGLSPDRADRLCLGRDAGAVQTGLTHSKEKRSSRPFTELSGAGPAFGVRALWLLPLPRDAPGALSTPWLQHLPQKLPTRPS